MEHLLALDGGGSKCDALLMSVDGRVEAFASIRPDTVPIGSELGVGRSPHTILKAVQGVIDPAKRQFKVLHLAGGSGSTTFNLQEYLNASRVFMWHASETDSVLTGLGLTHGLVALSGTGAFGHLRTPTVDRHLDGFGPLMGDWGGGHQIGRMGLRAAIRAQTHPRHATSLFAAVVRQMGGDPNDVRGVSRMIGEGVRIMPNRAAVARYAQVVDACAREGDAVACGIIEEAAGDMAEILFDLTDRYQVRDQPLILAGAGSVIQKSDLFWGHLCRKTAEFLPQVQPRRMDIPQVAGLALSVLNQAVKAGLVKVDLAAAAVRLRETLPDVLKAKELKGAA
jgi:N-acetylglucosamine kinase-like BadF-type ATPase